MGRNAYQKLHIYGIVQGVGFRPFIATIAERSGVRGSVCNKGPYVEIFVGGAEQAVAKFHRLLRTESPERSNILKIETTGLDETTFERVRGELFAKSKSDTSQGAEELTDKPFRIIQSEKVQGDVFVSPDIATCPKCEQELFDPSNRRYLHPFINCTACGPRMTILDSMPYDRVRTSMAEFPMCPDCEAEYTSPRTRRYHAQPICCNDCGPELYLVYDSGRCRGDSSLQQERVAPKGQALRAAEPPGTLPRRNEALFRARDTIRSGGIIALKGIGGFHLCCDATNEAAVSRLRMLKSRPFKPFAVMMKNLDVVKRECIVLDGQEELLTGPQKPILLLSKRTGTGTKLCQWIAPDNPTVGVMLPYNPVQYLLFTHPEDPVEQAGEPFPDVLVMTSGNPRGAPICRTDKEALEVLAPLCDLILSHNRKIRLRADDSVVSWHAGKPYMIRRSRGYAPLPFLVEGEDSLRPGAEEADRSDSSCSGAVSGAGASTDPVSTDCSNAPIHAVLGIGGELKNTFCLAKDMLYYPSPYIGDMANLRSQDALREAVHRMSDLLEIRPDVIVCDKHPLYHSSEVARALGAEQNVPVLEIQHHFAHTLSCMAENNYLGPVIGVSFDGTGYGTERVSGCDHSFDVRDALNGSSPPNEDRGAEVPSIWGGEFLLADVHGFERAGSLEVFPQAGGDASSTQGWRIAVSLLRQALTNRTGFQDLRSHPDGAPAPEPGSVTTPEPGSRAANVPAEAAPIESESSAGGSSADALTLKQLVADLGLCNTTQLAFLEAQIEGNINCIPSTSVGRMFDATSAILGFRKESTCEGEASMVLEFAAERYAKQHPEVLAVDNWKTRSETGGSTSGGEGCSGFNAAPNSVFRIPISSFMLDLAERRLCGESPEKLAFEFHRYIANAVLVGCDLCRKRSSLNVVALSGGVFQNLLLTDLAVRGLEANGFRVLTHSLSAPNDGGIGLGQALYGMFCDLK